MYDHSSILIQVSYSSFQFHNHCTVILWIDFTAKSLNFELFAKYFCFHFLSQPVGPRPAHIVVPGDNVPELLEPIPYEFVVWKLQINFWTN